MTIQEACQRLGKSESTIRRWIRNGKLTASITEGVYNIQEEMPGNLSSDQSTTIQNDQLIIQLRSENEYLKKLLAEAQQARERADMITMQLSRQLEQKALSSAESGEKALPGPSWLKRIFRKDKK
jgi:DNA-binding transcriptional MerR regulator